jgi:hypothetical protein
MRSLVFTVLVLACGSVTADPQKAKFEVDATKAERVNVPVLGGTVAGLKMSGTAILPNPGAGTAWWVAFSAEDDNGYTLEDYDVYLAAATTQVYGWPAAGTYNWVKTVHCVDACGNEVDWLPGNWTVTCDLWVTINVDIKTATDTIAVP